MPAKFRWVLAACVLAMPLAWPACGSRSGLVTGFAPLPEPTADFCATQTYFTGGHDLALYLLLDRSDSMKDDDKWQQATAALGAFVKDPKTTGLSVALQYFPLGNSCDSAKFAVPAVPFGELPGIAPAIEASLAQQKLAGETPTLPALRGAIEYSRALMTAEPSRRAVVALITDGAPNSCDSTTNAVAAVAAEGAGTDPQVLTFAIGFRAGFLQVLDVIAQQGGTGQAVVVNDGPGAGQELVDALRALRESLESCEVAVPPVAGATPTLADVRVAYQLSLDGPATSALPLSADWQCNSSPNGFYVDDPTHPTHVVLCPALCAELQANAGSRAIVASGCGGSFDAGPPKPLPDAGTCGGSVSSTDYCVDFCGASDQTPPVCNGSFWACPPGKVSLAQCASCPAVPHECCLPDGTLATASCIDGVWTCAAGALLYGTGTCKAPNVCAKTLPCGSGQYCESPSYTCGNGSLGGHCVSVPSTCPSTGPAVCGCDGAIHPNACTARSKGLDIAAEGNCVAPLGTTACGPLFCKLGTEICRVTTRYGGPVPVNDYDCLVPPPGCLSGCNCNLCEPCPVGKLCPESCVAGVLQCDQL